MTKWLAQFILGWPWCKHHWKVLTVHKLYASGESMAHGDRFVLQCEHCGDLKKKRIA